MLLPCKADEIPRYSKIKAKSALYDRNSTLYMYIVERSAFIYTKYSVD